MDLTEIQFITRLTGNMITPCMTHTIGFFKTPSEAETALKRNWSTLHKESGYREFIIEEILVGKILADSSGVASVKYFEVLENHLINMPA